MADIQTYLDYILSKVYGKDVRQAIVDAINQCYTDATAGITPVITTEQIAGGTKFTVTVGSVSTSFDVMNGVSPQIAEASTASAMTDTDLIYVYTKDPAESGFITGYWYFYDDYIQNWRSGGQYQSSVPSIDTTLSIAGACADAKAVGDELNSLRISIAQGGSFNAEIKSALDQFTASVLQLAEKVAYVDANGQDYYDDIDVAADALHSAMYPPANLISISAVYTQSGNVYNTDSLDSLKPDLVVTAHYTDSTTATVTNYVLSGTLAEGTSTITVTYGGKTTTFNVTVTEVPSYVTTGLIHNWDGINNTGNGDESHSSSTTTWADLVGSINLSGNFEKAAWASNGLTFSNPTVRTQSWGNSILPSIDGECTIEMVVTINDVITAGLGTFGPSRSNAPNSSSPLRRICIFSDGTLSGHGQQSLTYSNPEASLLDVHSISCVYNTTPAVTSIKVNGQETSASSQTHSLAYGENKTFIGMADGTSSLYGFNGTIHAIRIYNRVLTDEERLKNYNMDVSRFGFGV